MKKIFGLLFTGIVCLLFLSACGGVIVTINYDTDGGTVIPSATYSENTFRMPNDPTKDHYDFAGWYLDSELTEEYRWVFPAESVTITLYAKWELQDHILHLDLDGGTGSFTIDQEVTYGTNIVTLLPTTTPVKEGHTFNGWLDSENQLISNTSTITMGDAAYTVKASWTVNQYDVTLNLVDGSLAQTSLKVNYGVSLYDAVKALTPTKTGHTFDGWSYESNVLNEQSTVTMPAQAVSLTATYKANIRTITFDANGGQVGSVATKEVAYGSNLYDELVSENERPSYTGYNFVGWYLSREGADRVSASSESFMPDHDITLYARWTRITYNVSFDVEEAQFNNPTNVPQVINYGKSIEEFLSENAEYLTMEYGKNQFVKWVYSDNSEIGSDDVATAAVSLKAQWIHNRTITLKVDSGDVVLDALENEVLAEVLEEYLSDIDNTPLLENYLFDDKWSETADGPALEMGEDLVGEENIVLYPLFVKDPSRWITLTYMAYNYIKTEEVVVRSPVTLPEIEVDEGVTVDGWYSMSAIYSGSTVTAVTESSLANGCLQDTYFIYNCYTGELTDYTFQSNTGIREYTGAATDVVLPSVNPSSSTKYVITKLGNGMVNPYQTSYNGTQNVSLFKDNTTLKSVVFPLLCVDVFMSSFEGCTALENVKIFDYAYVTFGPYAFKGCTALKSIDLANIYSVSIGMFEGCTALTAIDLGPNVATIYQDAFKGCTSLPKLAIPRTVRTLYASAFDSAEKYEAVLNEGEKFVEGGIYSTDGKKLLNWLVYGGHSAVTVDDEDYPTINIAAGTEVIGSDAFSPTTAVKGGTQNNISHGYAGSARIILPSSVKEIESYAFATMVSYGLNNSLIQHSSVVLNEGLEKIGDNAFLNSNSITELNIPASVKTIGVKAFSLRNAVITFADNLQVETIADDAFNGNDHTTGDLVLNNLISLGNNAFRATDITSIVAPNLISIGEGAFYGVSSLVTVSFPKVTVIPKEAFSRCTALTTYGATTGVIDLGTVTTVETLAFNISANTAITSIINVDKLTTVAENAFILAGVVTVGEIENVVDLSKLPLEGFELAKASTLVLPEGMTTLEHDTLLNWKSLTTIGETNGVVDLSDITTLENNALNGCESMTTVRLNSNATFGVSVFQDCKALTTLGTTTLTAGVIDLSGFATLNNHMLNNCTSVVKVVLNSTLSAIPSHFFNGCTALTTVGTSLEAVSGTFNLPTSVKEIGDNAFSDCHLSGDIVLHEGLEKIGNYAFQNSMYSYSATRNQITSLVIPASVTSLGRYLIRNNTTLLTVVSNSSATIPANAFFQCSELISVTLNSSTLVALANASAFNYTNNCAIYVPADLVDAYKAANNWKNSAIVDRITAIVVSE